MSTPDRTRRLRPRARGSRFSTSTRRRPSLPPATPFIEFPGVTGSHAIDATGGLIKFVDINAGDQPTASTVFHSFTYQNAQHQDISQSLSPAELLAVQGVEVDLIVVASADNNNNGTATWSYNVRTMRSTSSAPARP